jgi:hypothetical protein
MKYEVSITHRATTKTGSHPRHKRRAVDGASVRRGLQGILTFKEVVLTDSQMPVVMKANGVSSPVPSHPNATLESSAFVIPSDSTNNKRLSSHNGTTLKSSRSEGVLSWIVIWDAHFRLPDLGISRRAVTNQSCICPSLGRSASCASCCCHSPLRNLKVVSTWYIQSHYISFFVRSLWHLALALLDSGARPRLAVGTHGSPSGSEKRLQRRHAPIVARLPRLSILRTLSFSLAERPIGSRTSG